MSNDVSRIYQFLAKNTDWQYQADANGDGAITKGEFSKFMEANFEWNGEDASAQKDLINSFWKNIDTNKSSAKIKGTRVKNNNALDSNEVNAMQYRIEMYETLNEYTKNLKAPNVLSGNYASQWKTSVMASFSNIVEAAVNAKKTTEELLATLNEQADLIQNKATADYCATEYLATTMREISQKYGYTYGDDSTLKGIIDSYVQSLAGDEDATEIKSTVEEIVTAYVATAGLAEDSAIDLGDFGYTQNESSPLNDLQKCVAKKALQNNLEAIKDDEYYDEYSALYDNAVTAYIEEVLSGATFEKFEEIQTYGVEQFKTSAAYKDIETTVNVKNVLTSDALYDTISSKISESLSEKIKKDGRYIAAFSEITNQAIEKAKAGDFDANGALDEAKLIDWVTDQIEIRLAEFYGEGLGSMSLEDLANLYDKLVIAADKQLDDQESLTQHRNAAINYCEAVAKKNSPLNQAVQEVFGKDYKTTINNLYPSEIGEKMDELKAKVAEIGDFSDITEAEKASLLTNVADSYSVAVGEVKTVTLPTSATVGEKIVTSDRIQYKTTGAISVDSSGKMTLDSSKSGTYSGTLVMLIDGNEVARKTVTISVSLVADLENDDTTMVNGMSIKNIMLSNNNMMGSDWVRPGSALSTGASFITSTLESLQSTLINGGYDSDKTKKAIDVLKNYYLKILNSVNSNYRGYSEKDYGKKGITTTSQGTFTYQGADGQSKSLKLDANWKEYKNAYDYQMNEITCTSGFGISHQRKGDDNYKFFFNTKSLLNMFKTVYDSI